MSFEKAMTGGGGDSERLFTGASREQGTTRLVVLPVLAFLVLYVILIPVFAASPVVLGGLLFLLFLLVLFFLVLSVIPLLLSVVLGGLFFLFLLLFLCYLLFLFRSSLSHCSRRFLLPVLTSVSYPYSRLRCVTCCSHSFSV